MKGNTPFGRNQSLAESPAQMTLWSRFSYNQDDPFLSALPLFMTSPKNPKILTVCFYEHAPPPILWDLRDLLHSNPGLLKQGVSIAIATETTADHPHTWVWHRSQPLCLDVLGSAAST